MSHTQASSILALFLLSMGCHAAKAPVRRAVSVTVDGAIKTELQSLSELAEIDRAEETGKTKSLLMLAKEGAPKDELLAFVRSLKSEILPWQTKAKATLKEKMDAVHQCDETKKEHEAHSLAKEAKCAERSKSHTSCRTEESTLLTTVEQLKAERAEKNTTKNVYCKAFKEVETQAKDLTATYGGGDLELYLEGVCTNFGDLLPKYEDAKKTCMKATAEYERVSTEYEEATNDYKQKKTTCNTDQTDLDVECCVHALATKDTCESYSTCYSEKLEEYKSVEGEIKVQENYTWVEWRLWNRIECLLPLLGTDDHAGIEECRQKTYSYDHLIYPTIPDKESCTVEEAYPGTDAYYTAHFDSLPENAKGKAVAQCTGMSKDEGIPKKVVTQASPAPAFIITDNSNTCPEGYDYLEEQQARDAVAAGEIPGVTRFGSAGNWANSYPKGGWKQGASLYFNTCTGTCGGADEHRALVCALKAGPAFIITENSNTCPEGYDYLEEQQARDAVAAGEIPGVTNFGSAGNWANSYPKGGWKQGASLYFNTCSGACGGADEHRALVCALTA